MSLVRVWSACVPARRALPGPRKFEIWFLWLKHFPRDAIEPIFVSGGTEGAGSRDLLVMAVARRVLYTGGIGSGSVAKLMHNCASFTLDLVMAECWTVAVKAGVASETIVEAFKEAALGHMMSLKVRLPATYLRGNFEPRFSLKLARKDLGLALELARATDVPLRLGALCEQEMSEAMARGWANRDASIFLTLQEERAGVHVRLPET